MGDISVESSDDYDGKGLVGGWPSLVLQDILDKDCKFVSSDSARLIRLARRARDAGKSGLLERLNYRRDFQFGRKFLDEAAIRPRVIGVYGNAHVSSPVLQEMLKNVPHKSYLFDGSA